MLKSLFAALLLAAGSAHSSTTTVVDSVGDAYVDQYSVGAVSVDLQTGEAFTVSTDAGDLWSAGPLPRWSNAGGLSHDLYATGTDESGEPTGTLIGTSYGIMYSYNGRFSAPWGALVGQVGDGAYFLVGTSYSGTADTTGTLHFFDWDGLYRDNFGTIQAAVSVPEPASPALVLAGLCMLGGVARTRRMSAAKALVSASRA